MKQMYRELTNDVVIQKEKDACATKLSDQSQSNEPDQTNSRPAFFSSYASTMVMIHGGLHRRDGCDVLS